MSSLGHLVLSRVATSRLIRGLNPSSSRRHFTPSSHSPSHHDNSSLSFRPLSSSSSPSPELSPSSLPYYFTSESDPRNHGEKHLGRIYRVPDSLVEASLISSTASTSSTAKSGSDDPEDNNKDKPAQKPPQHTNYYAFFPPQFVERCKALGEYAVMVRRPALEAMAHLRRVEGEEGWGKMDRPMKIVLYGKKGNGKTTTLSHIRHHVSLDDHVLLNFNNIRNWLHRNLEIGESVYKPGRFDHLANSQLFLKSFYELNKEKMGETKTHENYVWTVREKTDSGSPLLDVVRQGIDRPKFAADCLNVLLKELRVNSCEGKCRTVLLMDGANVLFEEMSLVCKDRPAWRPGAYSRKIMDRLIRVDEFSVMVELRKMFGNDYRNAVVVCSVDQTHSIRLGKKVRSARPWDEQEVDMTPNTKPDTPFALLGEDGWEAMDPFLPIEVPAFSEGEVDVMIDYYVDKKFLRKDAASDTGRQEIKFLTGGSPRDFTEFSTLW